MAQVVKLGVIGDARWVGAIAVNADAHKEGVIADARYVRLLPMHVIAR